MCASSLQPYLGSREGSGHERPSVARRASSLARRSEARGITGGIASRASIRAPRA